MALSGRLSLDVHAAPRAYHRMSVAPKSLASTIKQANLMSPHGGLSPLLKELTMVMAEAEPSPNVQRAALKAAKQRRRQAQQNRKHTRRRRRSSIKLGVARGRRSSFTAKQSTFNAGYVAAFKQAALKKDEIEEYREIFNLVDQDGGGTIDGAELEELMDTLGCQPSHEELQAIIAEADADGNGEIDFDEFLMVMSKRVDAAYEANDLLQAFAMFEPDSGTMRPGHIKNSVLYDALTQYGSSGLAGSGLAELIRQMEPDSTGEINYAEYIHVMMGMRT